MLQKEAPGDSAYAARREVAFQGGQKHGEERVSRADGTLESLITWNHGVKDARELAYSDDGKKVVKETIWKAGVIQQLTELYLNGNPKLRERYESPTRRQAKTFWDTGKVKREGAQVRCEEDRWGDRHHGWCEDGVQRSYFESGAPESEENLARGRRQGTTKTWFDNGQQASIEDYDADKLTQAKRWNRDGKLASDDEFESDGSRKIKH